MSFEGLKISREKSVCQYVRASKAQLTLCRLKCPTLGNSGFRAGVQMDKPSDTLSPVLIQWNGIQSAVRGITELGRVKVTVIE